MAVCIVFSAVIYQVASQEFDRPLPSTSTSRSQVFVSPDFLQAIREERAAEAKQKVMGNLMVLNLITLMIGACASYLFARRTLIPIEEAMDGQARFTSDASHELRTPLAVMRTESEVALRDKKPSVVSLKTVVESNLEEVERLQLLTDRLLALSSNQTLAIHEFSVGETAHATALRHVSIARAKNITLDVKAPDIPALGDSESVGDIISILIDNAIKYSPKKTTVTIDAVEHSNYVAVTVSDQGEGIQPQDVEHIFDRFYRADQSRNKETTEGYGLGLALARRLSKRNHGSLTVANHQPHGATFTLRLTKPKK